MPREHLKKAGIAIALLIVICVAIFWLVRRISLTSRPPKWVLEQPAARVDRETLEVFVKPVGEWLSLEKDGKFPNPKTGKYTLRRAIECPSCRNLIPPPDYPSDPSKMDIEERRKIEGNYKCPRCGAYVFSGAR